MSFHHPKHGTDPPSTPASQLPFTSASVLQIGFPVLMVPLGLNLLRIFWIRRQETFFNHLYANLLILSQLCTAIARPGTILATLELYDIPAWYCTVYVFMGVLEAVGVPLAMLVLLVERSIYFACLLLETSRQRLEMYNQRLSRAWKILVALPWIAGLLCACIKTFGLLRPIVPFADVTRGRNDTFYYHSCHLEGRSREANYASDVLLYTMRAGIPLLSLCAAAVVMLVYWCKVCYIVNPMMQDEVDCREMQGKWTMAALRRIQLVWRMMKSCVVPTREGTGDRQSQTPSSVDSAVNDSVDGNGTHELLEPADKTNATVLVEIVLALTCACVAGGSSYMVKVHDWLHESTQWLYFGLEFTAVILPYCFLEVRQSLVCRRCTREDQDMEMTNHCTPRIEIVQWESTDVASPTLKSDRDQDLNEREVKQQEGSSMASSGYSSAKRDGDSLDLTRKDGESLDVTDNDSY